jgi:hypothetical protein
VVISVNAVKIGFSFVLTGEATADAAVKFAESG